MSPRATRACHNRPYTACSRMADSSHHPWLICTDTGGTFTDCLARDPAGGLHRAKVLSTSALRASVRRIIDASTVEVSQQWGACDDLIAGFAIRNLATGDDLGRVVRFDAAESLVRVELNSSLRPLHRLAPGALVEMRSSEPAPVLAARLVTGTASGHPLPALHLRLATTRGTNALLERKGAGVAFFVTEGFGDLLHIGDQSRPEIFAQRIVKPAPLHSHAVEVRERLNADGSVVRPLDEKHVREAARRLRSEYGVRSAAIALMHSHCNPDHEQQLAAILRECGFEHVSISSEIAPFIRIVPRAQTAVVDAYLGPIIGDYLRDIQAAIGAKTSSDRSRVHVMTSAGSLNDASRFRACQSLLSGPAGGVLGTAAAGRASGFTHVIGFDMGGTSTDVCRCDGELDYRFEHSVGDAKLLAPALAIETVAAGGGSICDFIDGRLVVGPQSAGAEPGPACYGLGGPLTLTDVNLLLGRLSAEQFEIPISVDEAHRALDRVMAELPEGTQVSPQATMEVLNGFLEIANQRMAAAIEQVSLRRGYDVREYALLAFGGAGGQHACALAERLGMNTIVMPLDASLLSAAGLMAASIERIAQKQILQTVDQCGEQLVEMIHSVARQAVADVQAEGIERAAVDVRRVIFDVRLAGQDSTVQIDIMADEGDDIAGLIRAKFARRYEQIYGHAPALDRKPIEVESLRVIAATESGAPPTAAPEGDAWRKGARLKSHQLHTGGQWQAVLAYQRGELPAGARIEGPAIILDRRSSYVIDDGWNARIDDAGAIVATRTSNSASVAVFDQPEIVRIELFSHRFMSIATEMGEMLQRTALSTNVKERLDFSCTVLDAEGNLIANAPHLPVHLGAMGVCVRAVREAIDMQPGDVIITNHPAFGGSHLPDITIITPVFDGDGELIGVVANRAHHAELGGSRPGSMPPDATTLEAEGVVIAPTHLVRRGEARWNAIEELLRGGRWPSRSPADNLADLQAQVAANNRGASALRNMVAQHGQAEVQRMMRSLSDRAARLAGESLGRLPARVLEARERLDDGAELCVRVDLTQRPVAIDFAGTSEQHSGNLNATPAIVRSAVIYVLRLLVGEALPLNEGLMREIDVRIPCGSMLNPKFDVLDPAKCPAVVGGNTEVSQRLVDTLLKAFGIAACSQGTMNNVLFGNDRFGYYETVCGGSGATSEGAGADAVHVHMTNTRITDPEIIEHRYPARLERFAIRHGSGGAGHHRGGDGAVREITFLEPVALSVLTQHRIESPYGIDGGSAGACGRQHVIRATGQRVVLRSVDGCDIHSGDRLILETPGGGGWGPPETERPKNNSTP